MRGPIFCCWDCNSPQPETIPNSERIEEEQLQNWTPSRFFSVTIGMLLNNRYKVIGKLGYGGNSTIWLCKDQRDQVYVVVKVGTANSRQGPGERRNYRHLKLIKSQHPGAAHIRQLLATISVLHNNNVYGCLHVLLGLDFLHGEAKMVHTDLQDGNIMFPLLTTAPLHAFEQAETRHPSAHKLTPNATIYCLRALQYHHLCDTDLAHPIITDFGQSVFGAPHYTDYRVQPLQFRAPEVNMHIPWDEKIDIWSLVCLLFYMLFDDFLPAETVGGLCAMMGPPPNEVFLRCTARGEVWEVVDEWFERGGMVRGVEGLVGDQMREGREKRELVGFLKRGLRWVPSERASARDLLEDEWLKGV
ncbi:kinase-like protein [Polyplosphaeria fusca]|uniref:Kinase-like protein n=1 Tax=Polyplosphaeria fusca TaxID=682080 RepID=A0A9P4V093_9PLEO|nr:kinase-like protein [Polyplosphaeria fusca]